MPSTNVDRFLGELLGLKLVASVIVRVVLLGGLVMSLLGTGGAVLMAVLYNLISDVVGGVEITVVEEEEARRPVGHARTLFRSGAIAQSVRAQH